MKTDLRALEKSVCFYGNTTYYIYYCVTFRTVSVLSLNGFWSIVIERYIHLYIQDQFNWDEYVNDMTQIQGYFVVDFDTSRAAINCHIFLEGKFIIKHGKTYSVVYILKLFFDKNFALWSSKCWKMLVNSWLSSNTAVPVLVSGIFKFKKLISCK